MFSKYTEVAKKILLNMSNEMMELKHPYVGSEHLLLAILKYGENEIVDRLKKYNITYDTFKNELVSVVGVGTKANCFNLYTPLLKTVIENASMDSADKGKKEVDTIDLLISLFSEGEGVAIRLLYGKDINVEKILNDFSSNNRLKKNKKLLVDIYGINLNERVRKGEIDPVVGREDEVRKIVEILSRRSKNNPLLIGEAGVGKTAIVEEVARIIENMKYSGKLNNKKIISISMSSLVAGTKYRGEFEEKIEKMIRELEENDEIILFIDEIHTLVGAGGAEGAIDASNILKPALARGKLKLIGATTIAEYKEFIEKDKALARRFQVVTISEPSLDVVVNILMKLKPLYENFHKVRIDNNIIDEIVKLSNRYIYNKKMPDKAIDVLDQVCSMVSISDCKKDKNVFDLKKQLKVVKDKKNNAIINNNISLAFELKKEELKIESDINLCYIDNNDLYKKITINDVKKVISQISNVPIVNKYNSKELLKCKKKMSDSVIGQNNIVEDVYSVFKSMFYNFDNKPKSMLFVGGTGVGKTLLGKEIANLYCGKDNLIRLDMSEYKEGHSISKIIGSPPGYIGYSDNNNILEIIKDKPYSVLLLDEIEKANNNIINLFLQILDEGFATNSKGEKIYFNNVLIIMTSNIGSNISSIGFNDNNKRKIEVEKYFSKEFLNRLNKIIYFNNIDEKSIEEIINIKLRGLKEVYKHEGISLKFNKNVKDEIKKLSLYKMYGARKVDKIINDYINNIVVDNIIDGNKEIVINQLVV